MRPDNMFPSGTDAIPGRLSRRQLRRKRPYAPSGRALALLGPLLALAGAVWAELAIDELGDRVDALERGVASHLQERRP